MTQNKINYIQKIYDKKKQQSDYLLLQFIQKGTIYYQNGNTLESEYKNGVQHGKSKFIEQFIDEQMSNTTYRIYDDGKMIQNCDQNFQKITKEQFLKQQNEFKQKRISKAMEFMHQSVPFERKDKYNDLDQKDQINEVYTGTIFEGQPYGKGSFYSQNNQTTITGYWINGKLSGAQIVIKEKEGEKWYYKFDSSNKYQGQCDLNGKMLSSQEQLKQNQEKLQRISQKQDMKNDYLGDLDQAMSGQISMQISHQV